MKRNERASRLCPGPDDEALLLRQKHRLLQVRGKGDLPLQSRPDPRQWDNPQLQLLAEDLWAEWREAPRQQAQALGRLYLTHLLGVGGGRAQDQEPGSEGPAWRAAAWPPRAGGKQRAAGREDKSRKEELVRLQTLCAKAQRGAAGPEKKGFGKAVGPPHPPSSPPEKSKGKRGPSRKTSGGRRPADPRAGRSLDVGKPCALERPAAGETAPVEGSGEDVGRGGRRQLGRRTARLVQGLKNNGPGPSPGGQADDPEQPRLAGSSRTEEAAPPESPRQRGNRSQWKRELEVAFEELFDTNRRLKSHLSLHLEPRPATGACPGGEQDCSEGQARRGPACREKGAADADMEVLPSGEAAGPVAVGALPAPPETSLQKLLSRLESQKCPRVGKSTFRDVSRLASPEAGTCVDEQLGPCGADCGRPEAPGPDTLSRLHRPPAQADRAGSMAPRQKQRPGLARGSLTQLELLALARPPETSSEARGQPGPTEETAEPARARWAPSDASCSDQEEGGCDLSPSSPTAASISDDDGHSQMIRNLQQQILEQNRLHKQFLEEARKRLQEFQKI